MPKENIVLGVHKPVPPQGRVTVQLLDPDRPWRVRKEVRKENVVMNWWLSAANPTFRRLNWSDEHVNRVPNYGPNWSCTELGFTRDSVWSTVNGAKQGYWPGMYGNYMRHVWASDVDASPDADKPWIPSDASLSNEGNVTAMCSVDTVDSLSAGHAQRGTWLPASSYATRTSSRTVMEWGTTQGNGTWRSLGLGNVNSRMTDSQAVPQPWVGYNRLQPLRNVQALNPEDVDYPAWNNTFNGGESFTFPHPNIYAARSNQVRCVNISEYSTVFDYTDFPTGSGRVTVSHDGTDLWVARGRSVYRVDETDVTNVIDTYDLSASIVEGDIIDITSDKTDLYVVTVTHVHRINSSGVWQSSWAHGLTTTGEMAGNIEWDPNMDHLWLSLGNDGHWTSSAYQELWGDWLYGGDQSWEADNFRVRAFNKTGTQQPYWMKTGWNLGNDPYVLGTGFTGMDPQGWVGVIGRQYYNNPANAGRTMLMGPSAASHVNLGEDFVKTSNDSLQLIYDFNYS